MMVYWNESKIVEIFTLLLIPHWQDNQVDTDLKMSLKQHIIQTEFGNISVYIQVSASQLFFSPQILLFPGRSEVPA